MSNRYELALKTIVSFEDLLKRDNSLTIHLRNIQSLAMEFFEVKGNLLEKRTTRKINYHSWSQTEFASNVNINKFGLNSLKNFASTVRNMVLLKNKNILSKKFKNGNLCKSYIKTLGFVNVI